MRKVPEENEIPVLWLEEDEINRRIQKASNHTLPWNVRQAMQAIEDHLHEEGRKDSVEFMKMVYAAADLYMEGVKALSVCRAGCAHCCNDIPVELTLLEAGYIEEMTGHKINKKAKVRNKANNAAKGYCPFLNQEDAMCSIYEYRPLACRLFVSMDKPELCDGRYVEHSYHSIRSHAFWMHIGEVMAYISDDHAGKKKKRIQPISEIRSYFKK